MAKLNRLLVSSRRSLSPDIYFPPGHYISQNRLDLSIISTSISSNYSFSSMYSSLQVSASSSHLLGPACRTGCRPDRRCHRVLLGCSCCLFENLVKRQLFSLCLFSSSWDLEVRPLPFVQQSTSAFLIDQTKNQLGNQILVSASPTIIQFRVFSPEIIYTQTSKMQQTTFMWMCIYICVTIIKRPSI